MTFFVRLQLLACLFAIGFGPALPSCSKPTDIVTWPALREMDDWAEKAEGWAEAGNIPEMRRSLPEVRAVGKRLLESKVPKNAYEPKEVEQTLSDFGDLILRLEAPELSEDELKVQMGAIHPLVEKLMEASGMPHVHDHAK